MMYSKYPKLVEALNNRYLRYNETVEKIIKAEENNEIFVIRPTKYIKLKRIEKDPNKLQEMYDLGRQDAKDKLEKLIRYISK